MSTYIKHSEDDSLTHYGVKGMKWRKRKKKNNEWSERVMYGAGGSPELNRIRPFHDDGQSPDGTGYKSRQYNPSLKGTIERRKSLFKEGYYDRKEGFLKSRKNYPKAIKSSLNKAKKSLKASKKAASYGAKKVDKIKEKMIKEKFIKEKKIKEKFIKEKKIKEKHK